MNRAIESIRIEAQCPFCGIDLVEDDWIALLLKDTQGREGITRLSAFFGDFQVQLPFEVADLSIANFSCPDCHRDLTMDGECTICGAPLFLLAIKTGGVIDACCRRGCEGHNIGGLRDITEIRQLLRQLRESDHE